MPAYKYKEHFPAEFIRMSSEGKSAVQIAAHWSVSRETVYHWGKDAEHPEFVEAYRIGQTCKEAFDEDVGQKGMKGLYPKFQPAVWIYYMKCRHKKDWNETVNQKIELVNEIKKMSDTEIDQTIKTLLAQRAANSQQHPDKDDSVQS